MPFLVDGNNLLFAARDHDPERPPSRSTLCIWLGRWARRTGECVAIVFDGPAPAEPLAKQISDPDITVSFSGAGISADDVLIEMIENDSAPRRLSIVSSDREIIRVAKRRRAKPLRSGDFWTLVLRELRSPPPPSPLEPKQKREGLAEEETEHWLRELNFGEPASGNPQSRKPNDSGRGNEA